MIRTPIDAEFLEAVEARLGGPIGPWGLMDGISRCRAVIAEYEARRKRVKRKPIKKYKVDKNTEAVKVFRDGREVCRNNEAGRAEYWHRKVAMWDRDRHLCCICNRIIVDVDEATFEHKDGRGMGGARRDDRIEKNGVAHLACNSQKGSRRMK